MNAPAAIAALVLLGLHHRASGDVVPVQAPLHAGVEQTGERLIHVGQGSSGGRLVIDNHAYFMVTRNEANTALNWNNCGTFKWSFGRFGFDGPHSEYPLFEQDLVGSNAVTFDGGDKLRMIPEGGVLLPASICDGSLSVELWVRNPSVEPGEILIRIEDGAGSKELKAADFGMVASTGWQHLVAVSNGTQTIYYRNNAQVGTGPALSFTNESVINLGVKSLTGSIAAVRFHSDEMDAADIAHNFQGGVALGTYLFYCMDAEQLGRNDSEVSVTLGDPLHPAVAADRSVHETERFRSVHAPSKNPNPADDIDARIVSTQLPKGEEVYHWLAHRLAFHMPIVSTNEHMRGDGRKYKINHGNGYGGSFMGISGGIGFGWGITYAGYMNPHELVHGTQAHQMNILTGHWWETHANFPPSFANTALMPSQANPVFSAPKNAHSFPSTGGNYYQAYLIWEHLREVPEYGDLYSTWLWNSSAGKVAFPPKLMEEIDPDPATSFSDEWVKMAARSVRWDYPKHPEYAAEYGNTSNPEFKHNPRKDRTLLQPVPFLPIGWYEPPKHRAPQQHGYNLCPLEPNVGTVTAELSGLIDTDRGSHWKAMFMAVEGDGSSRYGSVFATGAVGSFEVLPGDQELYLVVSAVPTKVMEINIASDYRAESQDRFPYQVRLSSTAPSDALFRKVNPGSDGPHANGGGFVAGTARVDASAYVAPSAKVLGHARVLGNSRIEGNAVVSGYAIIDNAIVKDEARVSDFALLDQGCSATGNSRIMEHAHVFGNTTISGHAVCKGNAQVFGPVSGTGMVDGDYIKGNIVTKGIWLNWSWGSGQNAGEQDVEFNKLFLEYQFERDKAYRVWDTHGVTYAHMIGNPTHVGDRFSSVLELDGVDDFLDLPQSVGKHDEITFEVDVKWNGGAAGQALFGLTNPTTGDKASLVAANASGNPEYSITIGGVTQTVAGNSSLPTGVWSKVQFISYADTVALYVNDALVGSGTVTHDLEDIDAARVYVGRGPDGGFLNARIDKLRVWSRALIEQQAPTPNPPGFLVAPVSYDGNRAIMQALTGSDSSGPIEYFFDEVSGNPGGSDSGWQTDTYYMDGGLFAGTEYSYRVKLRDSQGNETAFSAPVSFTTPIVLPDYHGFNAEGVVVVEAENFHSKTPGSIHANEWVFNNTKPGYSGTGGMVVFDQGRWIANDYAPDRSPRMDYRIKFDAAGTYYLSLRGWGNNGAGASCHAGINMQPVSSLANIGNFDFNADRSYSWISNRSFTVPTPGIYMLNLWMKDDGAVIDKLMISGAQMQPSGVGPGETPAGGGESVAVPGAAPSAPAGLTGAPGVNLVDLSWNSVGGVIGYHVYRSLTPGGPYTKLTVTPVTGLGFRDAGAASTQANYYVVTAINSGFGESPASSEISVTAQVDAPPSAPVGLVVQSANGFVRVNWNLNPENDIAGYRVYRSASENDGYLPLTLDLLTPSQFFDLGAIPGVTYWYRIIAFDSAGNQGAPSLAASGVANPPATSYAPGTAVSINLGGNGALASGDQAGFNALANWNDFTGIVNPSSTGLVTSDNGIVPMSISASGGNDSFNSTATPDTRMYGSMLFGAYANLTGIPFSRYQLVIYYNSWANASNSSVIRFDLAGDDGPITSAYGVKKKSFNGVWDEFGAATMAEATAELQNGDGGFYLIVDGLDVPNLQISTTTMSGETGAISGIQIIAQEEPDDPGPLEPRVISVNYETASSSTPALAPADSTGVVPVGNWNNVVNVNHAMTFVDDSAASTPLTVFLSAGGQDSWNTLGSLSERLFGDKVNMGSAPQTLTLGNVPFARYDLYIYLSSWGNEVVNFGINGGPTVATLSNTFTPQFTSGADFVENDTYVKLTGVTGSSVVVNMHATSDALHLAGFQIVQVVDTGAHVPAAPLSLSAAAGIGTVSLQWPASSGAESYQVKRSSVAGGPYLTIATLAGTSYADNAVTNGTTYFYVVSASNVAGESADSPMASATPQFAPPAVPTGLAATVVSDREIGLSWSTASGATSYTLRRSVTSGGPYTVVASGLEQTSFNDSALEASTTYHYVVSAEGPGGAGANSSEVSATTRVGAPTGLVATATSSGSITLGWNTAAGATGYHVKRATSGSGPFVVIASGLSVPNFVDGGVSPATTYHYVVSATGPGGDGADSASASATTLPLPPEAPTSLVVAPGDGQITISWASVSNATNYIVKRSTTSGGPYSAIASNLAATSHVDTGLINGTTYHYVINAVNAGGTSPDSAQASTSPSGLPSPWISQDVGSVAAAGTSTHNAGTYVIAGSGSGIAGTADRFRFAYQSASADCGITVRVTGIENTSSTAKAGIVIRESTATGSRYAGVFVTPNGQIHFQRRTSTNGTTATSSVSSLPLPRFIRLTRTDRTFRAFHSANGTTWTQFGSNRNITMAAATNIGLGVTSGADGTLCAGTFTTVTVTP